MKIGIVTCKAIPELTPSEQPLIPLLRRKNIRAEAVVWNDPTFHWAAYDYLLFRSVWDYHKNPIAFNAWLQNLQQAHIKTLNAVEIIKANQHKFYLKKLGENGIAIVPTIFVEKTNQLNLSVLKNSGWKKAVIKPAVSASAYLTEVFTLDEIDAIEKKYQTVALEKDLLVQQFMPEIQYFGELSILFFNRVYSHTVLKTVKPNDFRVQAEYGGQTKAFTPDKKIIETAESVLSQYSGDMLYARVDGILKNNAFVLMEIELIEPYLFFDHSNGAIERFVEATIELVGNKPK